MSTIDEPFPTPSEPGEAPAPAGEPEPSGPVGSDPGATSSVPATQPAADVAHAQIRALVEALVFASDRPLGIADIARAARADRRVVRLAVEELQAEYRSRGIQLEEVAGGWAFRTSPAFASHVREAAGRRPVRMSRAQLETLAIVAYRQPITRPEVDDIRGVDSGPVLKTLLERDLVRILGKKDEPGRPLLYGTTAAFLELFGLRSLSDLPSLREFTELSDDSRRVLERSLGEQAAADPDREAGAAAEEGDARGFADEATMLSMPDAPEGQVEDDESSAGSG